ncbi:hypothetical protein [Synechococcus sp. CS-1328]|uniref:hypothetical protein n=1 Tax=Synechococcus sp. CS-1328 TaxID=2847976 RepID=UPI0037DA31C8
MLLSTCLAGSFSHDHIRNQSYVLCERFPNLAFFSGFHRHGALRNPTDSFTANFCHPNALTALMGARMMDKISPTIQVSSGIHNIEAQYIKVAKNISFIFAGFDHAYHRENTGILVHDASMVNLLCMAVYGKLSTKYIAFSVSQALRTSLCQ